MSTVPAACAGVVQVTVLSLTTDTLVAATPPTVTPVTPLKPLPVIVIDVPPDVLPRFGLTPVGAGVARYVKPLVNVAVFNGVVMTTSTAPAACAGTVHV